MVPVVLEQVPVVLHNHGDGSVHAEDLELRVTAAAVNPDAVEECDGIDNDCDALSDEWSLAGVQLKASAETLAADEAGNRMGIRCS